MTGPVFSWGDWTFEPGEWRLSHASGGLMSLPNRTLDLLALLLDRAPGLVTKDEILATVWRESVVEEGNIAVHIAALRRILDAEGQTPIETVRGRGYRFVAPVTRRVPEVAPHRPIHARRRRRVLVWATLVVAGLIGAAAWFSSGRRPQALGSITVQRPQLAKEMGPDSTPPLDALIAAQINRRTTVGATVGDGVADAESVLTTRVDRSDDGWRVSVEVTRRQDERRLWSSTFEVATEAPALAGAEISAQIATGLARHFGVARPREAASAGAPEVQALVLEARSLWRRRSPADIQQAIRLYERAIALDPASASAFAGLADAYNLTMSGLPPDVRYPRAKANAERAVALDSELAAGHASLAFLRYKFEWRWADAEVEFKRAIALDPNYPLARHWYGEFLGIMGRYDEAVAELRRALALEPDSLAIQSDLVPPLLRAGRTAEARAIVESAARTNPNWHWIPLRQSEVLAAEGRERESLEERWRWMVLSGASVESVGELQEAYRTGGLPAVLRIEIRRWLAEDAATPGAMVVATNLSRHYARLGDRAEALRWISIALDRREDAALLLLTHPDYDRLRGDPEFDRLMARVGLTPLPFHRRPI